MWSRLQKTGTSLRWMLQLFNCCLEDLKTWSNCNIRWEGIPLDSSHFVVVLASMDLTDCHREAIPGDPICGLYVIRKGHGHEAIYYFVKRQRRVTDPTETAIANSGIIAYGRRDWRILYYSYYYYCRGQI